MSHIEKLKNVFAPLDYAVVTKVYEYMCLKDEEPDIPDALLDDAKLYLGCGQWPDRNPTCWWIFRGEETSEEEWKAGVSNFYRIVSEPQISELDLDRNYIKLEVNFEILVVNAKDLPETAFEGVECIIVKTSFGDFHLIERSTK